MAFSATDLHRVGEILAFAARTEIMPRFRKLAPGQIHRKSSAFDLVTEADEAAEAVITTALIAAFPGAMVIGEESAHKNPALLDTIAELLRQANVAAENEGESSDAEESS